MTMVHIAIDLQDESEVERVLSLLNQGHVPHRVERRNVLSDEESAAVRERLMRGGSHTLDMEAMIADNKDSQPYRTPIIPPKELTVEEKRAARESVMKGSPTLDIDAMLDYLRESRQDRKMPFRDYE